MPRLAGAVSVSVFIVLTGLSYGLRLKATPLPVPIFPALTILLITSGSIMVSYIAARAYMKERLQSMLFLGSGSLIFGATTLVAALTAGQSGSNPATTIFIVGGLLSSALHLSCAASRFFGSPNRRGSQSVAILTITGVLLLAAIVMVAAFQGAFPTFLIPGVGITVIAKGLLAVTIATFSLAALLIGVSSSRSSVLYWYSYALAMTAVGLVGILLSDWIFGAVDFWVGRIALCAGGVFLVLSVRSAERAVANPDSVLEELFKPIVRDARSNKAASGTEREAADLSLYEKSMLLEADPSSHYERAVRGFAQEMVSSGRVVFAFTTKQSPVYLLLSEIPDIRFFILSDVSYPKATAAPLEVLVPGNDRPVLLTVMNEAITKTPEPRKAIIFDNVSPLILEAGYPEAYKFLRQVNEMTGDRDVISLFIVISKALDEKTINLVRNLYSAHLVYDASGLIVKKHR